MSLLKRKAEKTTTISIRIPISAKDQMTTLKPIADAAEFDLAGSLSDAVVKWLKDVSKELQSHIEAAHKSETGNPNKLLGRPASATASSPTAADSDSVTDPANANGSQPQQSSK